MPGGYDIAVIGGGPAGYAAAIDAAGAGASVVLIERNELGGTCLHRGCIPTKQLLETAAVRRTVMDAASFGVVAGTDAIVDWPRALQRKSDTVASLHKGLRSLMKKKGVETIAGTGQVEEAGSVTVSADGKAIASLAARSVLVATGSEPRSIAGVEIDGERFITSDHALILDEVPERLAIVGAGAIGVEFASLFAALGSRVTLIEAMAEVLPGADSDIARMARQMFTRRGIEIHTGITDLRSSTSGSSARIEFVGHGGDAVTLDAEKVLIAAGRVPVLGAIDGSGIEISDGFIRVNASTMETSVPGVYAAGDVVATPALAHVGFAEGMLGARAMRGEQTKAVEYGAVPWCVYSHPEIAFAGLTEERARDAFGGRVQVAKHRFGGLGRALIIGEPEGMVKVISVEGGPIAGIHIIGPWASELLSPGYLAVNLGIKADVLAGLIQPHPTLSEAFGEAVQALTGRALHG